MSELKGKTIAILATDGFEQSELLKPRDRLKAAGAKVDVVSLKGGEIRGWDHTDWGEKVRVDKIIDDADVAGYDALVLPGGQINPDLLRLDKRAVAFVKDFYTSRKPLAAICHGPWLLVEADVIRGHKATSYPSIRTDMKNAGAEWVDSEVVVDDGLVTSRKPDDLDAFCDKIIQEVKEGKHAERRIV